MERLVEVIKVSMYGIFQPFNPHIKEATQQTI